MNTPPTHPVEHFNQEDPHGFHAGDHHGHTIIPAGTLVAVLGALVVFTILTVFVSRAEGFLASTFHMDIPQWVNVVVALSIALVKGALVCMFFMQLKYDNPLHTMIMLFCLFALVLFLFFSMMDLGSRGVVYHFKSGEVQKGGQGLDATHEVAKRDAEGNVILDKDGNKITERVGVNTGGKPIVVYAREKRIAEIKAGVTAAVDGLIKGHVLEGHSDLEHGVTTVVEDLKLSGELSDLELQRDMVIDLATKAVFDHEFHVAHAGGHHAEESDLNTGNRSRPRTGRTPGLMSAPAGGAHGGSSSHGDSSHGGGGHH